MADYRTWPEKQLAVTSLQLDPQNPRIPAGDTDFEQPQLIAELVEHDYVYDLAKDIVDTGYNPLELLLGIEHEDKTYVVEGNRRLAALKLLISPELAPEKDVKKFRSLRERAALDTIKKIRVVIAPSREATAPLILQKHTHDQVQRWSPIMQARFYHSLSRSGLTLKEMAERYRVPPSEIAHFLRLDTMYKGALGIDLPPDAKEKVHNPRDFPASVLERLLDYPLFRDMFGIQFDEEGGIRGKVDLEEFRKGYRRILADIANGNLDTRIVNKVADAEVYLKGLGADTPDLSKKGTFTGQDLIPDAAAEPEKGPQAPKKPKSKGPRRSPSVIPSGMRCRVQDRRIVDIFKEVSKIDADKFPNVSAVMLRILLELSIVHYLEKTGGMKKLADAYKQKGRREDWSPTLRQMLDAMLKDPAVSMTPHARKKVNKLVSTEKTALSLDDLDGFVHNPYYVPNANDLHAISAALEGIWVVVLQEPPRPAK